MRTTAYTLSLLVWQADGSGRVCWNRYREAVLALPPVGDDRAVSGVVLGVELRECRIEVRVNGEMVVAGTRNVGVDASGAPIDP